MGFTGPVSRKEQTKLPALRSKGSHKGQCKVPQWDKIVDIWYRMFHEGVNTEGWCGRRPCVPGEARCTFFMVKISCFLQRPRASIGKSRKTRITETFFPLKSAGAILELHHNSAGGGRAPVTMWCHSRTFPDWLRSSKWHSNFSPKIPLIQDTALMASARPHFLGQRVLFPTKL